MKLLKHFQVIPKTWISVVGEVAMAAAVPMILILGTLPVAAREYSWQKPHAVVSESGGLQWNPEPFVFEKGSEVRYIDYENGNDANDGKSKTTPWKHHPWDGRATDIAAEAAGSITYVFKRGVTYHMFEPRDLEKGVKPYLIADESGMVDEPIRLTSDPSWGSGEAVLAGSMRIPEQWTKAGSDDVPDRMDHTNVWFIETSDWWPRHPQWPGNGVIGEAVLFEVVDGATLDLHVARDPDWQESHVAFAMDYWHQWDGHYEGKWAHPYDEDLKGFPADYFTGGKVWSQYTSFMGTPIPYEVDSGKYNPETGVLKSVFMGVKPGSRYMIEDLPQFLDSPKEYYWDENGTRRLFVRLTGDRNPNQADVRLAACFTAVSVNDLSHISVTGLSFKEFGESGSVVSIVGNCTGIVVGNCRFDHVASNGIKVEADKEGDVMKDIVIRDNEFTYIRNTAIDVVAKRNVPTKPWHAAGIIENIDVLRNRTYETGFRHNGVMQSNVPAIDIGYPLTAEVAGNVVNRSFGSGLVIHGGKSGGDARGYVVPLTRILVHHNKVENTALGVNDYGGLALWQGGPIYAYCNISGNAVGHWPGGYGGSKRDWNLSYPIYLDGSYKTYTFNNITWQRTTDEIDPYHSTTSAYFMVFGFLNPVIHNTFFRSKIGLGGSSGNRNDVLGNLFVEIGANFLKNNRTGNPSLVGGNDDGSSGIRGIPTLAYGKNVFHGTADAGVLALQGDSAGVGAEMDIEAEDIITMAYQMKKYPVRHGDLGWEEQDLPIIATLPDPVNTEEGIAGGDFRPNDKSLTNNNGVTYFVPWALSATVGEWHFNKNDKDPSKILDYHWYMDETHIDRKTYEYLPYFTLGLNDSTPEVYVPSALEDWTQGAVLFDGNRYASVSDDEMRKDIVLKASAFNTMPMEHWILPEPSGGYDKKDNPVYGEDQVATFPGERRNTLDIDTSNMLVEAVLRVDQTSPSENGIVAGKHDGVAGYRLYVTPSGMVEFEISVGGNAVQVSGAEPVNDGEWRHVLAEVDRVGGTMRIYVDGALSNQVSANLSATNSLSNTSDFVVGRSAEGGGYFYGALDFLRVCKGTLADAATTIEELYEWQTNGPVRYDFAGNAPRGKRDIGALENGDITVTVPDMLIAWDFEGEGDTGSSKADYFADGVSVGDPSGNITMGDGVKAVSWGAPGGFTFANEEKTLAQALDTNRYLEFSIAPEQGDTLDISSISLKLENKNDTKVRQYALFSSELSFAEGNEIVSDTISKGGEMVTIPMNGFENVTESLTFRIYFFGADGGIGGIGGVPGYDLLIKTGGRVGVVRSIRSSGNQKRGLFRNAVESAISAGGGNAE